MDLTELQKILDPILQFFVGIWMLIKPLAVEASKIAVESVIGWLRLAIVALQGLL